MVRPADFAFDYGTLGTGLVGVVAAQVVDQLSWTGPVRAATTVAGTLASSFENGDTVDGVVLATGDRVLIKDQAAGAENGIYVVNASGAPTRASDFDSQVDILGSVVVVTSGTTNANTLWQCTTDAPITVDTTVLTFVSASSSTSETPFDHGSMGATETLDLADGAWHRGTLSAACTITVQGFTVDQATEMIAELTQNGTGGWGITWDPDVVFVGSDQPDLTAGAVSFFLLWTSQGDSVIYGSKIGAGGGLTIKEEGVALATLAESLDFVGAGVVASGTGVAKTITISGAPAGAAGGDLGGTYPNPTVTDDSHSHTGTTLPTGLVGELLLSDAAGSPVTFADILQNEAETDLMYADP